MRWLGRVGFALFGLVWANGFAFGTLSLAAGGDAINGREEGGRFYLSSHGRDIEVSEGRWRASRMHGLITFASLPLGVAGILVACWAERRARSGANPACETGPDVRSSPARPGR